MGLISVFFAVLFKDILNVFDFQLLFYKHLFKFDLVSNSNIKDKEYGSNLGMNASAH